MRFQVHIEITAPIATVHLDASAHADGSVAIGWDALDATFEELPREQEVACVVVRGAGAGNFALGTAAHSRGHAPPGAPVGLERGPRSTDPKRAALRAIQRSELPTIAMIEGLCVEDGLEIAASCDLRVCGESARFGEPSGQAGPGSSPDGPSPLQRLLGPSPVMELLLRGELIGARLALKVGLVNRVHADRAVAEQGYGLAARIAAGAPLVNRWHKRFVHRLLDPTPVSEEEREEAYAALATAGYDEGRMMFLGGDDRRFRFD